MSCGVFIYLFFFPQLFLLSDNDGQAFSRKRPNGMEEEKKEQTKRERYKMREREKKRERKREREMVRV